MKKGEMVQGHIYLAEQRTVCKSASSEVYGTFHDKHDAANAHVMGRLMQANAVILEAGRDILLSIPEQVQTYLLPIGGEILLAEGSARAVDVGEILIYDHGMDRENLLVMNPYQEHPTSFVQFSCRIDEGMSCGSSISGLGIDKEKDRLLPIDGSSPFVSLYIGLFGVRKEDALDLEPGKPCFFAYVLAGSFEVEGRLLRSGDSLLLWDLDRAEMESLNDSSILFVVNY